jgi:hypothetical protein
MGYELHITRKPHWFDAGPEITLDEWTAVVRSDPEMRLDGFAKVETTEGETLRTESPDIAVWTAYAGHGRDGNMAWMYLSDGCVVAKNPDKEIVIKMLALARGLGARVQGDDCEFYGDDGEPIPESSDESPPTAAPSPRKPWWRFW